MTLLLSLGNANQCWLNTGQRIYDWFTLSNSLPWFANISLDYKYIVMIGQASQHTVVIGCLLLLCNASFVLTFFVDKPP